MHRHLAELGFYVGGTSLLLLMLASMVAAWGVRRRLAPLRELADSASAISASNWSFQPPADAVAVANRTRSAGRSGHRKQRRTAVHDAFQQQRDIFT